MVWLFTQSVVLFPGDYVISNKKIFHATDEHAEQLLRLKAARHVRLSDLKIVMRLPKAPGASFEVGDLVYVADEGATHVEGLSPAIGMAAYASTTSNPIVRVGRYKETHNG